MKNYLLGLLIVVSITFANDIDLDTLTLQAKKSNKHIFVYLHITGCDFCMRMEEFAFDDDDIISAIKKDFIFVDINVKDKGVVKYDNTKMSKLQFAKESGYPMYPTCLFFDKNGELVYDAVGYKDENKLLKILNSVSSKSYDVE
ncbi:MAG: Cytochrome c-type biogenesis protein DsbD, protein-disulfide reductase (EC [uncultured Sulfurovum sp.]|uniref:Cytochrome c-type biogenesis protein DsbD, protein-disulfide reductase (EC) n=1 Tax=uncultured Sulfurovum sp. TaxID=269237 RepID=A0A6S6SXS0_9BACT|nr:MAG: Cytochrome c-type biogenesis protein DsbD, protein-disulfide reductase (EC [uncultured Sulfurovum sp.]